METTAAPDPVELAQARVLAGRGRRIRLAASLSLRNIAAALGVTPATVMQWESGEHVPRDEHAIAYAALLRRLLRELDQ